MDTLTKHNISVKIVERLEIVPVKKQSVFFLLEAQCHLFLSNCARVFLSNCVYVQNMSSVLFRQALYILSIIIINYYFMYNNNIFKFFLTDRNTIKSKVTYKKSSGMYN